MPKPAHTRVTFSGIVGEGAAILEEWSFNLNFPAGMLSEADLPGTAENLADLLASKYNQTVQDIMPLDVSLTKVRVAAVDALGHVETRDDGSYLQGDWTGDLPGAMAKQPVPLQTALCVSLSTARPGPTGKGRFFLPWPALSLDADDKRIPIVQAQSALDQAVQLVRGAGDILGEDPVVVSSKGYVSTVTGLKVGRVPDTMRSRREDLVESYLLAPLRP